MVRGLSRVTNAAGSTVTFSCFQIELQTVTRPKSRRIVQGEPGPRWVSWLCEKLAVSRGGGGSVLARLSGLRHQARDTEDYKLSVGQH